MKYINDINMLKILGRRSVIFCKNTRGNIVLSKPSSILVIKVEVHRSEDAETRRKKETASGIHHDAVTKASADDTF